MAARPQPITFRRTIAAPPAEVYRAFTHSTALRDWLADVAEADPHAGGHLFLRWNSGYATRGEYTALEAGRTVAFTWHGRDEPEPTRVRVTLVARNGGTRLSLAHSGLGSGKKWAGPAAAIRRGWEAGLENLQSVLEHGTDLRLAHLPRMGIYIGDFSAEIAQRLGTPVSQGVYLEGTADGTGARDAGLEKGDVIVRLAGRPTRGPAHVTSALAGRRAGDVVPVVYYRGAEKRTARLKLSSRPAPPPLPATAAQLAENVRILYAELLGELKLQLAGVSDSAAEWRPAPGEWTLKELLGHYIATERDVQSWLADMLNDNTVRDYLEFRPNVTPRLAALVARFGTVRGLQDELRQAADETLALLAALPPEFVARQPMFRRAAQWTLVVVPGHFRDEHRSQLDRALEHDRAPAG